MRLIFKHFLSIFACFVILTSTKLISQNNSSSKWTAKFEYQKAFIENRGQFSIPNSFGNPSEVLYAVDHGGTKIYFTKKGVTYSLLEATKTPNDEREWESERTEASSSPEEFARYEKEEHKLNVKSDQVTMLWQNANNNVQVEAMGLTGDYHNYSVKQASGDLKNVSYIKGYKKITYKNIYPNIDIEYVFAEKGG
ncbi:MAG: hypothetical protein JNM51_05520, partial [Bacteroidia bacterium]|nr:hypothetical protein [Bacteroidia bacterium]